MPDIPLTVIQDERRMARFAQYAMVASEEALKDAGWSPKDEEDLEATVQMRLLTDHNILTLH
jgi:3-oxoacyl-(acyl-carrier-protein) synthase